MDIIIGAESTESRQEVRNTGIPATVLARREPRRALREIATIGQPPERKQATGYKPNAARACAPNSSRKLQVLVLKPKM